MREIVYKCVNKKCGLVAIGKFFKWNKRIAQYEPYCKKCLKGK